jgi:methionyl-tRNA synthetase
MACLYCRRETKGVRCPDCIGPVPDRSAKCTCGQAARAKCDKCGANLCGAHWWKHTHAAPRQQK